MEGNAGILVVAVQEASTKELDDVTYSLRAQGLSEEIAEICRVLSSRLHGYLRLEGV